MNTNTQTPTNGVNTNILQESHKIFCDKVFTTYCNNLRCISELANEMTNKINEHREKNQGTAKFCDYVEHIISELNKLKDKETHNAIEAIEKYFMTEYTLKFVSYPEMNRGRIVPLDSYQVIIDNIVTQVGPDLALASSKQIENRLKTAFYDEEEQPILKINKISFPSFARYKMDHTERIYSLSNHQHNIKFLLDSLSWFFTNCNSQPEAFKRLLDEWSRKLDIGFDYLLSTENKLTIKFFKNGRVDVLFGDDKTAEKFWNVFELAEIAAKNRAKNR